MSDPTQPAESVAPEDRWKVLHEFSEAEEHEFCSWCAAPAHAECHRPRRPATDTCRDGESPHRWGLYDADRCDVCGKHNDGTGAED